MELQSRMPSALSNEQQTDVNASAAGDNIKWDKEISFEEAHVALEEKFYGFKKVMVIYSPPGAPIFSQHETKNVYKRVETFEMLIRGIFQLQIVSTHPILQFTACVR